MKTRVTKTFDELIKHAPKLEKRFGISHPDAFKEKMEKAEQLVKLAGLPKLSKE